MADTPLSDYRSVVAAIDARGVEWDFDPSLDRMADLVDLLGSPQRAYPVIHVAGTNGKSSTARLIAALLRERGLRVGLYTSPHLVTPRERIAIDGEPIGEEAFVAAYADIAPYLPLVDGKHPVRLSYFEVLTAMAFAAFADAPVDVAVVEVGLGGSFDATNVADGQVAVVTPVALDHTRYLGDTVEEIAAEKAGIIKPGAVAVIAQQSVAAAEVLLRRVAETGAAAAREGIEFGVLSRDVAVGGQQIAVRGLHGVYDDVFLPLFGDHQSSNAATAIAAVEAFASGGPTPGEVPLEAATRVAPGETYTGGAEGQLDPALVRSALAKAESPGRLEVVRSGPAVLVDATHNPAGMAATVATITESFGFTRLVGVFAGAADKDLAGVLDQLEPVLAELVVTRNSSPRSMPAEELGELAESVFGPERVHVVASLDDAIDQGIALAEETGEFQGAGVLITGSVVTAGDARTLLRADGRS
ncbi:Folylpolyglutamate synthase [Actinomadura rubteroloni]|uniref:Dihydrofolate synthase/folylpolyglutamate synthase n=1 Tax=Actinomadura rubteroloni TaxID=1926885 RepID=A0A2P4URZ9_9ACTN|nr:folylpolyglutamate synthase/dihydrofolate synthase family protein [Actinomadura rubteroloni]POM27827.1 Folylpolyglutamate synthase [Actinomadura rubteroloni]